ncbi:MAG: alpha/beta hydrolase [Pseudomonadota bacterium]
MSPDLISVPVDGNVSMAVQRHRSQSPDTSATPVICIPGLTRNARDFSNIGETIAASGRDVFAVSLRGRGASDRDPDYLRYHPDQYVVDIQAVLARLGIPAAVFLGTSLGGIVTMRLAETAPAKIHAAIINDVGPDLAPEGLTRIGAMAARAETGAVEGVPFKAAVEDTRATNELAFPGRPSTYWEAFAKRLYRQVGEDQWELDYDRQIARALAELGPAPDLWPGWQALGAIPTLLIRGELSDLLTSEIVDRMRAMSPAVHYTEVSNTGHAPMLDEPDAQEAMLSFLSTIS